MRQETNDWLAPMLKAAETSLAGPELVDLMAQAAMPAVEAADPAVDLVTRVMAEAGEHRHKVVEWVRFGQLLRERLGWLDYPEAPP